MSAPAPYPAPGPREEPAPAAADPSEEPRPFEEPRPGEAFAEEAAAAAPRPERTPVLDWIAVGVAAVIVVAAVLGILPEVGW